MQVRTLAFVLALAQPSAALPTLATVAAGAALASCQSADSSAESSGAPPSSLRPAPTIDPSVSQAMKGKDAVSMCPRATREDCNRWCATTAHPHDCYDICRKKCPPCRDSEGEWCDKQ